MSNTNRILYWTPRLLCIAAILFISLFSLDAFDPNLSLREQLVGFLIHMIPSFILLLLLVLAWKRELVGGILFALISLALSPFVFLKNYQHNHSIWTSLLIILTITVPFLIVGILFIVHHVREHRLS